MNYHLQPLNGTSPKTTSSPYTDTMIPVILRSIREGRNILFVDKALGHHLEVGAIKDHYIVTQQYEGKRFHLKRRTNLEETTQIIREFRNVSLADTIDWYPTLIEWSGLRFKNPLIFCLLNERYSITSSVGITFIILIGMIIMLFPFSVSIVYKLHSKITIIPFFIFAAIVALRIEFEDYSKSSRWRKPS